jgi:hypothetical protein
MNGMSDDPKDDDLYFILCIREEVALGFAISRLSMVRIMKLAGLHTAQLEAGYMLEEWLKVHWYADQGMTLLRMAEKRVQELRQKRLNPPTAKIYQFSTKNNLTNA